MRNEVSIANILKLDVSERIQLVEDVWDSVAAVPEAIPLTDKQKKELADKEAQLLKLRFKNKQNELQLSLKTQAATSQKNQFEARINAAKKDKEIITQQNQINYNKKWNL